MPIQKISKADAVSKRQFHNMLQQWLRETDEKQIGDESVQGRSPWVFIKEGDQIFRLHADTKRSGVKEYLQAAESLDHKIEWQVVRNRRGRMNSVAFGPGLIRAS
jgi:hypothetical protein